MNPTITIVSPLGPVLLRPEREEDQPFRYELFCNSRLPEWYQVELDPAVREQLMQHQFNAQTVSYRAQFPNARFDIIWLDGRPIGRIIVDGPHRFLHIVDQAIVPELRSRGIGSAIMRYFMDRAAAAAVPVELQVASTNDPSMQLYLRLGFVPVEENAMYINMRWQPPGLPHDGSA
jgi:ribosomal protein S18 acetylase RimI-like enzyme